LAAVVVLASLGVPATATATITTQPGPDTVSTSRLELDFGDAGGNVERLDSIRWRDSGGVVSGNLALNSGVPGCGGEPGDQWGRAGSVAGMPQPVGDGTTGTWIPRGARTVEIASSRPTGCTGDTTVTPVRTRYTFFDVGNAASKVRVERRISFSAATPAYSTASMRAYVPELPLNPYNQVIHPNAAGDGLVTNSASAGGFITNWNKTWIALNDGATGRGVLLLREPPSPNARIALESNGTSDSSSIDLIKPSGGWKAPVTETEWLCFYDAGSWPVDQRTPTNLPLLCKVVAVPINTGLPTIAGAAKVGGELAGTGGTWDYAASLSYQWLRCTGGACAPINGATGQTYTPGDADEGKQLRLDVTATAAGGETDTATSAQTGTVAGGVPLNTGAPSISGTPRQDETLTGTAGAWTGVPSSFEYQWLRCSSSACNAIAGATGTTYTLAAADVGFTLRLRVRAFNGAGSSAPADSEATGVVQRLLTQASLSIAPAPTCTGVPTELSAGASKTVDGPFVRYRFVYKQFPALALIFLAFGGQGAVDRYFDQLPETLIADGPSPEASQTFTWNRAATDGEADLAHIPRGTLMRDPVIVRVTVTDAAGATATAGQLLEFPQTYASQPRSACPHAPPARFIPFDARKVARSLFAESTAVVAKIPCATVISCTGRLEFVTVKRAGAGGAARKSRQTVLARNPFFTVAGGATATVKTKLTPAGRRLVKRRKPISAKLRLTTVDPTGRARTRSARVRLRPRKRG
jgi:hypothetical protein